MPKTIIHQHQQANKLPSNTNTKNDISVYEIEFHKSFYEYLKHISTLSTGSILLLAAFLEKLFLQPEWKFLVGVSIGGFLVAVISTVISYTLFLFHFPGRRIEQDQWEEKVFTSSVLIAWLGFLTGVIALAFFILRNLFV
jgi:hypothetical protein